MTGEGSILGKTSERQGNWAIHPETYLGKNGIEFNEISDLGKV